jgi:FKBP-type peptidyl-prolyl cis-trans isomerase
MRVGGRRKLTIPLELGPAGMRLPPGVPLLYDVTINEVFENYLN